MKKKLNIEKNNITNSQEFDEKLDKLLNSTLDDMINIREINHQKRKVFEEKINKKNEEITRRTDETIKRAQEILKKYEERKKIDSQKLKKYSHNYTYKFPDPNKHTMLSCWTTEDGNVLKISTTTSGKKDGEISFRLNINGEMTKQRAFMEKLLNSQYITVQEIIDLCYSEVKVNLTRDSYPDALKLLNRVRSLVSDIRTKLGVNGINKEIISTLGQNANYQSKVILNVKHINKLDEKHFESKNISSYKPPDELSPDIEYNNSIQTNELNDYNPDKYLNGFDNDIEI